MHFGTPVLAFDCVFNRRTTEDAAAYFADAGGLERLLSTVTGDGLAANGAAITPPIRSVTAYAKLMFWLPSASRNPSVGGRGSPVR